MKATVHAMLILNFPPWVQLDSEQKKQLHYSNDLKG